MMLNGPTEDKYKDSIVKIVTYSKVHDYLYPWMPPRQTANHGSGFIIFYELKAYLLTSAHLVQNATLIYVRFSDESLNFLASVDTIDHHADLACLNIENASFWEQAMPIELGEMPNLRQKVHIMGFPDGGEEFHHLKSCVSRINVGRYQHSGVPLLLIQVDSMIGQGHYGGPAVYNDKVIGMAFQNADNGENLGYLIPPTIIGHFLKDGAQSLYKGFPYLAIHTQPLTTSLKQAFGLELVSTGIRVKKTDPLSSAKSLLLTDDILLALDDYLIKDDGTIETSFSHRVHYSYLISQKSIGELVEATVWRNKTPIIVRIPLNFRCATTHAVHKEYDKSPSYYIYAGIVFTPLTKNYLKCKRISNHDKYLLASKSDFDDEIVIINQVLLTRLNAEIGQYNSQIVKSLNNEKVKNLKHLKKLIEKFCKQGFILKLESNILISIPPKMYGYNESILKEFNIENASSKELKTSSPAPNLLPHFDLKKHPPTEQEDKAVNPQRPYPRSI